MNKYLVLFTFLLFGCNEYPKLKEWKPRHVKYLENSCKELAKCVDAPAWKLMLHPKYNYMCQIGINEGYFISMFIPTAVGHKGEHFEFLSNEKLVCQLTKVMIEVKK